MSEKMIPILPCRTLRPVLDFYTALGFGTTFQQRSPNPYAVVQRDGIELHFFGMKQYDPAGSYSTCLIATEDVDGLHEEFRAGLKAACGRVPVRGLPRLGPLKDMSYGVRQFLMTDPGGNCIRVVRRTSENLHHRSAPEGTFARALHHASLFADSREDLAGAARVIDRALGVEDEEPTRVQLLRLLVLRADVAGRLGDEEVAASALVRASGIRLLAEERDAARDALMRLEELRAAVRP
ncbi:bleomycin resistance protein [Streptomyces sp. NPDC014685]|uniref:bleomycin resistance protein n=1 Tax=Streptomyces sp. NPDC014685 TaxID=3364881 RepID=UPI0036F9C67E